MLTLSGDLKSYAGSHRNQLAQSANHLSETLNQFVHHGQCRASKIRALKRLVVEPLVHEIHTLSMALQPYRVTLSNLPLDVKRQFVSANGLARVATYSNLNLERTDALQRFVSQVTHVLPQAGGTPVLFVKGGHIVVSAFKEATLIAIGLIIFIVFAVFRRPRNVLLTVTPLIISVLLTVALMAIFHINFNLANIIVIPLTIGLSVAFGIYVIVRWEHFDCRIASVLKSSIPEGVLVSGLTTLASFGSLSISSDPAMASLGQTLAIALTLILLASLVVLPAILALVEKRIPRASNGERDG